MGTRKTVRELCEERGLGWKELAQRSGRDARRARAIVEGHWTPSPAERERVAAALGLGKDEVAWGHEEPVQHLYGHGPQFGRTP
jgi:cyanate lyase